MTKPLLQQRRSAIGGSWTPTKRPCSECGAEHHHLTDMADGRKLCFPCYMDDGRKP